jgi:hypothetical protein
MPGARGGIFDGQPGRPTRTGWREKSGVIDASPPPRHNSFLRKFVPRHNSFLRKFVPKEFVPKEIRSEGNSFRRKFVPKEIRSEGNSFRRKFVPKEIRRTTRFSLTPPPRSRPPSRQWALRGWRPTPCLNRRAQCAGNNTPRQGRIEQNSHPVLGAQGPAGRLHGAEVSSGDLPGTREVPRRVVAKNVPGSNRVPPREP